MTIKILHRKKMIQARTAKVKKRHKKCHKQYECKQRLFLLQQEMLCMSEVPFH